MKQLFSPIQIGKMRLKNRLVMPPIVDRLAVNGMVSDAVKDFYVARARGGVGLMVLTPGLVDRSMTSSVLLGVYEDRFIPKLKELTDLVHANGASIGIELMHFGRQGAGIKGYVPVGPSPIPWSSHEEPPRELTIGEIERLVDNFSDAARRVRQAGFDMVELHACHGYLLSSFLSPNANQRCDKYGGDPEKRARFVVEIIRRIKEKAGEDFPVSCRINGTDNIPGGVDPEMAISTARCLEAAGADLISVSAGVFGSFPVIIPPYDQPMGCNVPYAEKIKKGIGIPVAVAGRLNDPAKAEEVLACGKADLIAVARGLIADPDLPNKIFNTAFGQIRRCIACNACFDLNERGPIRCTVNPEAGRENEMKIQPAPSPRSVSVIGGGLAGLETARVAAMRGHQVCLYEKEKQVGGQWLLAAVPPNKQDHGRLVDFLSSQMEILGVQLKLGQEITAEMAKKLTSDVVVVATGARPSVSGSNGVNPAEGIHAWDVLQGQDVGGRVLIIGGGMTGLETAEYLLYRGKQVVLVEQRKHVGYDMGRTVRWHLTKRLKSLKIEIFTSTTVKDIKPHGTVSVVREEQTETWSGFDAIIRAYGVQSQSAVFTEIKDSPKEVYIIGDAARAGMAIDAMRDGAEIARKI
ncbi:MAG: FAD-dependent oxidoreductase [Desulfobacterales bacterium]|nr:FAD-dependent oxidoreductase [Desulfobacterales bacterium]